MTTDDRPRPEPRRRAPADRRPRPHLGVVAPLVVVVVAALAVLLTFPADAPHDTSGTATPGGTSVDSSSFVCPDLAAPSGTSVEDRVGLVASVPGEKLGSGGTLRSGPVDSSRPRDLSVERGRQVVVPDEGGAAVQATGDLAAGVFGSRVDVRRDRSTGVAGCVAPRSQWWFTGAGAGLDHASTLVLANVDPGPAVVDLRVLGPDGQVETVATKGIPVPPHSVKTVELDSIAPQTDDLALGVHATRGRVAASVEDAFAANPDDRPGREWLAGTELPSRSLRLAGLPVTASRRTLLVANPGDSEAVVSVRVAGTSGSFAPTGLDEISVDPGAVASVDVADVLPAKEAVGLRLRSTVPVVAAVRSSAGGDHAYATVAPVVRGAAVAPLVAGQKATVQLTAGAGKAAHVTVTAYADDGRSVDSTDLEVAPTATTAWSPGKGSGYVVVVPHSGTVDGAVTYTGDGLAATPLVSLPLRVLRPVVRPATR